MLTLTLTANAPWVRLRTPEGREIMVCLTPGQDARRVVLSFDAPKEIDINRVRADGTLAERKHS